MPVSGAATFMISVRNELGVAVGHADGLTQERVSFHVNVPLALGERVEFRLELPGADDTVLGWLVVESGQGPPGTLVHYRGRVTELDPGDVACFQRWVQAVREGHVALDLRGDSKRQGAFVTMHGATDEETQSALRRMDERRSRLSRITQVAPVSEEPTDEIFVACVFESTPIGTVPTPPVPASQAPPPALAVRPDRESPAEARARLLHELLAEADARTRPAPAAPPAAAPDHKGPWVSLRQVRGHDELTVAWMDHRSLAEGPVDALLSGLLRLRRDRLPTWPEATEVHLVTPGGHDLVAPARLVEQDALAVVYELTLDEAARRLLVAEARSR